MKMEQKYFVIRKCEEKMGKTGPVAGKPGKIVAGLFEPITSFEQAVEVSKRMRKRLPGMFPLSVYLRIEELEPLEYAVVEG